MDQGPPCSRPREITDRYPATTTTTTSSTIRMVSRNVWVACSGTSRKKQKRLKDNLIGLSFSYLHPRPGGTEKHEQRSPRGSNRRSLAPHLLSPVPDIGRKIGIDFIQFSTNFRITKRGARTNETGRAHKQRPSVSAGRKMQKRRHTL